MTGPEAGARVAIALGSNLGDRRAALERALAGLRATAGLRVLAVSSLHDTAPVGGPPGQPRFLNAALIADARLDPHALLARLQELERAAGRDRRTEPRSGPRPLDLDLLTYGELELDTPTLTLPHPRLEERLFVLAPLAEIAPGLRLVRSGRTVAEQVRALAQVERAG